MSSSRLGAGLAALVLALGAGGPLAGCGDDEEEGGEAETTITNGPTEDPETAPEDPEIVPEDPEPAAPEEPGTDAGGTGAPVVPDEGHEGGGPDPGTEEAEQAEESATGGVGSGPGSQRGDEPDPPEAFEQFCEENPEACE